MLRLNKTTNNDLSVRNIESIFYKQIRALTMKTVSQRERTFDLQFSDSWL